MPTQPGNQRMNSNSHMLLLATWLWIFAGTLVGAMIGVLIVKDAYYIIGVYVLYTRRNTWRVDPEDFTNGRKMAEKKKDTFFDPTHYSNIG